MKKLFALTTALVLLAFNVGLSVFGIALAAPTPIKNYFESNGASGKLGSDSYLGEQDCVIEMTIHGGGSGTMTIMTVLSDYIFSVRLTKTIRLVNES